MQTLLVFEWILVLLGHIAFCCVMFNLVHATAAPITGSPVTKKFTEKLILGFALLPLAALSWYWIKTGNFGSDKFPRWISLYMTLVKFLAAFYIVRWLYRTTTRSLPDGARLVSSKRHDIQARFNEPLMCGTKGRVFRLAAFNQSTSIQVENWDFGFEQLPDALDGFKICQLSDLHFTGVIKREYFESVIEHANSSQPDLVILTGDIVDEPECLDWIGEVLGKLEAKFGVFYVLGNHDLLIGDQINLRRRLNEAGLRKAANGKWHLLKVGDANLILAGNELPWYQDAKRLPRENEELENAFRVLLSHSPDQIGWAVYRKFDLMFAGHTHGGQIRLPIVGPIIAPSRYGIKYASGTFQTRSTLMHVSRGISSDEPIRISCPPELGIFTLRKRRQ